MPFELYWLIPRPPVTSHISMCREVTYHLHPYWPRTQSNACSALSSGPLRCPPPPRAQERANGADLQHLNHDPHLQAGYLLATTAFTPGQPESFALANKQLPKIQLRLLNHAGFSHCGNTDAHRQRVMMLTPSLSRRMMCRHSAGTHSFSSPINTRRER